MFSVKKLNEKGSVQALPVLLIVFAVGIISYLLVSSAAPFNGGIFNNLFPKKSSNAATASDTTYAMKVLVLKYFPLTPNGQNIDVAVTGDVGDSYSSIHQRTINITNNLLMDLPKATSYLGYQNPTAPPALTFQIVDTKEYTQAVPFDPNSRRPLYNQILTDNNICSYVQNQGVSEVWFWAYQGPTFPGSTQPYLGISESKMSGPFGDISNSLHSNDMPQCGKSYRVYTFNYGRGTGSAVHSWGHQIEAEMAAVDSNLFQTLWQGSTDYHFYPQTLGVNGRCGNVHNPPNARTEYDWVNSIPQNSDCLNWNPDGLGILSQISCQNWGCQDIDDNNNPELNYIIWNMQNIPGRSNSKSYQGNPLRNWWDVHGNFDQVMGSDKTLLLAVTPTPPPSYPAAHIKDTFNRADNQTSLTLTETGQDWNPVKGTWGIIGNSAFSATGCPAPGYAVVEANTPDGILHMALPVNRQDVRIPFRYVDLNNMYWIENIGSAYHIDKFVGGVRTTLTSTVGVVPANGDIIDITLDGSSIQVSVNNIPSMNIADNTLHGTKHGIGTWCDTSIRFDNFSFDYTPPVPSPTANPTPTPSPTLVPTPTSIPTPIPTPTPTPTPAPVTSIFGNNTVGGSTDSGDPNFMNGSQFGMGTFNGSVSSMSVYVAKINTSPNNKYQLAIYTDNKGKPGTLVSSSQTGTLVANSWNSLPISATLSANTKYWLIYNTNGSNPVLNNMKFSNNGVSGWSSNTRVFGSWPPSFGAFTSSNTKFSIYATYTH